MTATTVFKVHILYTDAHMIADCQDSYFVNRQPCLLCIKCSVFDGCDLSGLGKSETGHLECHRKKKWEEEVAHYTHCSQDNGNSNWV